MKPTNSRNYTEYLTCSLVEYLVGDGVHPGWLARRSDQSFIIPVIRKPVRQCRLTAHLDRTAPFGAFESTTRWQTSGPAQPPMKGSNYVSPTD
jgi:hypothetical protein